MIDPHPSANGLSRNQQDHNRRMPDRRDGTKIFGEGLDLNLCGHADPLVATEHDLDGPYQERSHVVVFSGWNWRAKSRARIRWRELNDRTAETPPTKSC